MTRYGAAAALSAVVAGLVFAAIIILLVEM